jgi:hypothetical protein
VGQGARWSCCYCKKRDLRFVLGVEAAHRLTDPEDDYAFPDLETLARVGKFEDFMGAGLKVAQARVLEERLQPGGETYNMLVLSGRLRPTKVEPPKHDGNPNDGSSSRSSISARSGITGSNIASCVARRALP